MIMWKKIEVISKPIPNLVHNGFIYNLSGNSISNIQKTVSVKMPFKMINIKNLYNFELFFNINVSQLYYILILLKLLIYLINISRYLIKIIFFIYLNVIK